MLGIVSSCAIVTLSLSRFCRFFPTFDFKNAVTLTTGLRVRQCHWKCHHAIQRIRRSIVIMALSRVVSEIFSVEKCRDLEIGFRGHSRSLKMVPLDRLSMVFYKCSIETLSLRLYP